MLPTVIDAGSRAVRATGLIAFVASVAGWLGQLGWLMHVTAQATWWAVAFSVLLMVLFAPLSWFYFAISRNDSGRLSPSLQRLALGAAVLMGVLLVVVTLQWVESFRSGSVLFSGRHWQPADSTALATIVSDLAAMALLIALSRDREGGSEEGPVSKMLKSATRLAVIVWGGYTGLHCIPLLAMPYSYLAMREDVIGAGHAPPSVARVMWGPMHYLIESACLLAAPYVVWRSIRRRPELM